MKAMRADLSGLSVCEGLERTGKPNQIIYIEQLSLSPSLPLSDSLKPQPPDATLCQDTVTVTWLLTRTSETDETLLFWFLINEPQTRRICHGISLHALFHHVFLFSQLPFIHLWRARESTQRQSSGFVVLVKLTPLVFLYVCKMIRS